MLEQAQDEMLRAHLDQMSNLMIDQKLGRNKEDTLEKSVRTVARARTISVLLGLDSEHKRRALKRAYDIRSKRSANSGMPDSSSLSATRCQSGSMVEISPSALRPSW